MKKSMLIRLIALLFLGALTWNNAEASVCGRGSSVRNFLTAELKKDCSLIQESELAQFTKLGFGGNDIELKVGDFSGFFGVKKLIFEYAQLPAFPQGIFTGLTNLQYLEFDDSDISHLERGTFLGLSSVKDFKIDSWEETAISRGFFAGLGGLEKLTITHKLAVFAPNSLDDLVSVKELNFNAADLPSGAFDQLQKLEVVSLEVGSLPANLFAKNANLRNLYIGNLNFPMPEVFKGMAPLSKLHVSASNVPNLFNGLPAVDSVEIYIREKNSTQEIPDGMFFGLESTKRLVIELTYPEAEPGCKFQASTLASSNFKGLSSLQTLRVSALCEPNIGNNAFEEMPQLKHLVFDSIMGKISHYAFRGAKALELLSFHSDADLTSDPLTTLPDLRVLKIDGPEVSNVGDFRTEYQAKWFSSLVNLRTLQLVNTKLKGNLLGLLDKNLSLVSIDLRGSNLPFSEINQNSFVNNSSSIELLLLNHSITKIEPGAFSKLKNLKWLYPGNFDGAEYSTLKTEYPRVNVSDWNPNSCGLADTLPCDVAAILRFDTDDNL